MTINQRFLQTLFMKITYSFQDGSYNNVTWVEIENKTRQNENKESLD